MYFAIMVIQQLSTKLPGLLEAADEVWIAVALATDEGLDFIRSRVKPGTIQHYLIGIDIGTPVSVLYTLKAAESNTVKVGICHPDTGIFHPKLYLFRSAGKLTAILGSANLTLAGLSANQELSTLITDPQTCSQLQGWFVDQLENSYPLSTQNLLSYQEACDFADGQGDAKPKIPSVKLEKAKAPDIFYNIDFADRYFKKEHHMAFRKELWKDLSKSAERERKKTVERFLELHEQIFHRFAEFNLVGLHPNVPNPIVSNHYHTTDRIGQDINAMWLSYGKSQKEIAQYHNVVRQPYDPQKQQQENDFQSFMNHARLQIRLELKQIGIWILFGKNNGSLFDRDYFHKQMRSESFRENFFDMVKALPDSYRITVDKITLYVNEISSSEELFQHCKLDHKGAYFIIGRDYKITAPEMSEAQLPETTLTEFVRLFPIYKKMRHYFI